jgi:hypothetical protein
MSLKGSGAVISWYLECGDWSPLWYAAPWRRNWTKRRGWSRQCAIYESGNKLPHSIWQPVIHPTAANLIRASLCTLLIIFAVSADVLT